MFDFRLSWRKNNGAVAETKKKGGRQSETVNRPNPDRVSMQMDTLREAVTATKMADSATWYQLRKVYENTMTDGQVRSQCNTAINKLIAEPLMLSKDGNDDEETTQLFNRPWFNSFIEACFYADLWGYTVVEFGYFDENNEFMSCKVFPRANIYPGTKQIIKEETDTEGIPYGDTPEKFFLLELKEWDDIGLLELISREVIWKAFARSDWSQASERWGQPTIVVASDAEGEELAKMDSSLKNFGKNGYFLGDFDPDAIKLLEAKNNGQGYLMFEKNIHLCNEEISKLINGQTGTSDNQAWAGTAEVHSEILDDYHHGRLRRYTNIINYKLIPFLIKNGYALEGYTARFTALDPKSENIGGSDEETGTKNEEQGGQPVKKPAAASRPW